MKSYPQIYKELKSLVRKIPACNFIPDDDRDDIVSETFEKIYKMYTEGKLEDDFNKIKGYNFIIIRNMCFSYKKRKKIVDFCGIIDDMLEDIINERYDDDDDYYTEMKAVVLEHSRYYKFTSVQRQYIQLAVVSNLRNEAIKSVLNLTPDEFQRMSTGTYHRLRGRKNKTYKYKIYDIEKPDDYDLHDTSHSVIKSLELKDWKELKEIVENGITYKNKIIIKL
jgi:DNA-directed RNA polymerase specialized sigma24 family protein